MADRLLSAAEAARELGLAPASLHDWLSRSNAGDLVIRGQPVTIAYFQGGTHGQGRIKMEAAEVLRLKDLMRVHPHPAERRLPPARPSNFPGITVKLGRPDA
jgi:hypothetical protein